MTFNILWKLGAEGNSDRWPQNLDTAGTGALPEYFSLKSEVDFNGFGRLLIIAQT